MSDRETSREAEPAAKPASEPDPGAVLFDLDGVLIESREVWFRLLNTAADHFGAPGIDREAFAAMWGQGVDADAEHLGCTVGEAEAFFSAHFMDFPDALEVDPAGSGVLATYRQRGVPTALVTNTPSPLAAQILHFADLRLDAVVGGTDVPHAKPAPDIPLEACRRLAVRPDSAVFVGDSRFDRESAAAAGIFFVGLRIDGDRRIESLSELPQRDRS